MAGINDGLGSVFRAEGPEAAGRLRRIPSAYNSTGVGRGIRSDVLNEMGIMGVDPQLVRELDQKTGTGDSAFGIIPNEIPSLAALQEELAKVKSMAAPISSSLSNLQASKKVSEKIEAMPDDSDVFAPSALDMMAAPMPSLSINSQGDRVLSQTNSAGDEAKAQDMIVAKRKKQQEEQLLADKNREASLDMPSDPAEQLFSQAMTDYISQARTGVEDELPEVRGIDDLKGEFAKATGIDISGKPDTSQALMAMGLSMMQNRAGKGFNVGRMLNAVGEAGEKAMPALAKANAEARNNVIAAGKYALTAQDADEKTRKAAEKDLMERGQFYVFEKGPKGKPYLNFDNGDLSYLNKSELNKLMNNKDFNDKYSFIAAKDYFDLQKESAAPKDLGNPYGKEKSVSLLGGDTEGVNPIYIVEAQQPDGNYKGSRKQFGYLQSNPESVVRNIVNEQQSILTEQKEFKSLIESVQSGVSIPKQIGSSIVQFGRNLGIDLGSGPTQIAQARKKLEKIQLLNATEILRESGKTLSDQDRERVKSFVGSIDLANADEALILQSIGRVYDIILGSRQRNLDTAVSNLETNFGIKFNAGTEKSSAITKEELEEINKTRQQNGLKPRTMDDYQ